MTTLINSKDPGSFTTTVDFISGVVAGALAWALYKIEGYDPGFPFDGAVGTFHQAGNGAVTAVLTAAPTADDITLAITDANAFGSTGATPGATFGSTYGTWTQDDASDGTKENAWVVGQRTGSTSTNVEFSDVNAHNAANFSSGQAAIVLRHAEIVLSAPAAALATSAGIRIANILVPSTPATVRVVFEGQSMLKTPTPSSADYAMEEIGPVSWRNPAFPGGSWTVLLGGGSVSGSRVLPASLRVFPYLTATVNVLVCLGGTTDILTEEDTAEQAFDDLVAYVDAARAVDPDILVVAGTIPPSTLFSGPEDTERLGFNSLLLADADDDFDATFDVTVPPLDDPSDSTYYEIDGLHWKTPGAQAAGSIMSAAIIGVLP
jgi:hypothetical protein